MKLLASKSAAVKVLASVALVGTAASVAGLGTFGAFTDTTAADQSVATGKLDIGTNTSTQSVGVAATNMIPGDNIQRSFTLNRSSDTDAGNIGGVTLTTAGATSNLLTGASGLKLKIEECSVAWTKSPTTNDLNCTGTGVPAATVVLPEGAVVQSLQSLPAVATSLNSNAVSYLKVTMTLPSAADNTFQGLSNTINFKFDATQRANKAL